MLAADKVAIRTNITALLVEFCSIYKVDENKNLSDAEISEIVNILTTEYQYINFKWNDLLLFLRNVKMGKYGKIYGSLDMPTFFQMLQTYSDNRIQEATTINQVKAIEQKKEALSEDTLKMIEQYKLEQKVKRAKSYEFMEQSEATYESVLINQWRLDFIEIHKEEKDYEAKKRGFINIDGVIMSLMSYLQYRNKQETDKINNNESERENM